MLPNFHNNALMQGLSFQQSFSPSCGSSDHHFRGMPLDPGGFPFDPEPLQTVPRIESVFTFVTSENESFILITKDLSRQRVVQTCQTLYGPPELQKLSSIDPL